jgi:4-diphosphocytidyl-2-C-methyl-D-erythritol kinase
MAGKQGAPLVERAPAKVNLTLRVLGRRADGMHELESLVVFAGLADQLTFIPGGTLGVNVTGPYADACGSPRDNLVLSAAYALAEEIDGLALGSFGLMKMLPVAAGIGGGSADAAAALRLLGRAYGLAFDDIRLFNAARRTGADVPVCLDPRTRLMRGTGDVLSAPVKLPRLPAVLVNPGVPLATKEVFKAFDRQRSGAGGEGALLRRQAELIELLRSRDYEFAREGSHRSRRGSNGDECAVPDKQAELIEYLRRRGNDLEPAAISLQPEIADVLGALRRTQGCLLARMSGAGATCFGIYESVAASETAGRVLSSWPSWWVRATLLG